MALQKFTKFLLCLSFALPVAANAVEEMPKKDQVAMMEAAKKSHHAGVARKTKEVDARPASPGEIVITFIKGQGVETRSKPAEKGDWVVRNRCEETGDEEVLVKARNFSERYGEPISQSHVKGYRTFKPKGSEMNYFIVPEELGPFNFKAPWGETMVALPGDAIVQVASDSSDTYRVAAAAFQWTYEITTPAKN